MVPHSLSYAKSKTPENRKFPEIPAAARRKSLKSLLISPIRSLTRLPSGRPIHSSPGPRADPQRNGRCSMPASN